MQTEKQFNTGELTINYFERPATGTPLVLLHGLTATWQSWDPVLPELTKHGHVYAPDFRGHGKSGRAPDNQYRNVDYARDVIAFLRHIGEPVVLMGHSLGALIAIVTASQYSEGLRALVLFDPPLYSYSSNIDLQPEISDGCRMVASVTGGNPSHETMTARIRAAMPDVPEEQIAGMVSMMSDIAAGTVETALRGEIWQGVDLPHALQSIRCPTLLIHGDWDHGGVMRESDVEFFKTNCPLATVVHLEGADHGLKTTEQPQLVLQAMQNFLQPA